MKYANNHESRKLANAFYLFFLKLEKKKEIKECRVQLNFFFLAEQKIK